MTFIANTPTAASPVFDYSSRDYSAVFADLVARIPLYLPEWTSTSNNDFGIVLLQMFAYVTDLMSYYLDRLAGEAFIQTATQSVSIINLAAMLDYQPTLSSGATVELTISLSPNYPGSVTIPTGTVFSTASSIAQAPIYFQTLGSITIVSVNNATPGIGSGTVDCVQGTQFTNEAVATSNGTVNQAYPLLNSPVSVGYFSVDVDLGGGPTTWSYVPNLINAGPFDTVYTNFVDSNGTFYIIFGDGVNGLIPTLGSPITATYMTNVGSLGNVGAGTIVQPVTAVAGVAAVSNANAASGGADAESLASIQQNAPASLVTLNRGVTTTDIETLAAQVAGVQWVSGVQATYQLINLYVVPAGGGSPSTLLQAAIQEYLAPLVMANTTVTIVTPTNYIPVTVAVNVVAFSNYGNDTVQNNVILALTNLLNVANTGFGFRISLGLVYQAILSVEGVNYAIVTGLSRITLTQALTLDDNYSQLQVVELAQQVSPGDTLIINPGAATSQTIVAAQTAVIGATTIQVDPFTANATYAVGTGIQDGTSPSDVVTLDNEVPIAGGFVVDVSGGFLESA